MSPYCLDAYSELSRDLLQDESSDEQFQYLPLAR
jgi:hypothetical protein